MTQSNKLLLLFLVTAAVIVLAVWSSMQRSPVTRLEHELLFPEFADAINEVAEIEVSSGGRTLTMRRRDDGWVIAEADNYPADFGKIRQLAINIAELEVVEGKTANPERYATLGVEDPETEDSTSVLLTLKDTAGSTLVSVIVGKRQQSSAGGGPGRYVRLPGEPQSLLVSGNLDAGTQVADWVESDLLSVDPERVSSVTIGHVDGETVELRLDTETGDLALANLPEGKESKNPVVLNRMKEILEGLRIENVRRGDAADLQPVQTTTRVETVDGLIALLQAGEIGGESWLSFSFEHEPDIATGNTTAAAETAGGQDETPPEAEQDATDDEETVDVAAEVAALTAKTEGWLFMLPDYQLDLVNRTMDRFSQDKVTGESATE